MGKYTDRLNKDKPSRNSKNFREAEGASSRRVEGSGSSRKSTSFREDQNGRTSEDFRKGQSGASRKSTSFRDASEGRSSSSFKDERQSRKSQSFSEPAGSRKSKNFKETEGSRPSRNFKVESRPENRAAATEARSGGFSQLPASFKFFFIIGLMLVLVVFARLFYLQIIMGGEYRGQSQATRTETITVAASRGTIYDRKGNVLAISVPAVTIYANPQEIEDPEDAATKLAETLGVDRELIYDNMMWGKENDKQFIYIKRQADLQEKKPVEALNLAGVYFLSDTKREYPYGQVAGQIVGLCDAEGVGICGLELYYNDILSGVAGEYITEIGNSGLPIPGGLKESKPAINGQDIMLTIDIDMQKEVEDALVRSATTEGASSTSSIVMDASNGEILAMASLPLFNPADTSEVEDGATTLWPVSIFYEPGSTFKTISATSLLEHQVISPDTQIYCPVKLEANEKIVTDAEPRNAVVMDLNRIIAVSSNVGIVGLVEEYLGFDVLYKDIVRYGFTEATGIDFPGETSGYVDDYSTWTPLQAYNVSFGQGISVSGLQLTRFYGALANDGIACTPHLLLKNITTGKEATYPTKQIINNPETVNQMAGVLRHVITEGTGWLANISDYYVVGKSGTAEIFENGEYQVGKYNRSFVGYLTDASTPLVCYFCAQDVPYVGSVAPVTFRSIMMAAIERYRVTSQWDGVETTVPGVEFEVE